MGIPSTAQNTIFDYVLTKFAIGFNQAGKYAALQIAKMVYVGQYEGKYLKFDDDAIYKMDTARAPGEKIRAFSSTFGSDDYKVGQEAIAYKLAREHLRSVGVTGVALDRRAMMLTRAAIDLVNEFKIAALLQNPANYPATNRQTLSGASQVSNPASDLILMFQQINQVILDATGEYLNQATMTRNVFNAIQRHPQTRELLKYYPNSSNLMVQIQAISDIYGLGTIRIPNAAYRPEGSPLSQPRQKIWNNCILCAYVPGDGANKSMTAEGQEGERSGYEAAPQSDMAMPSAFQTFGLEGETLLAEPTVYDEMSRSYYYPLISSLDAKITNPQAAYLISSASAT